MDFTFIWTLLNLLLIAVGIVGFVLLVRFMFKLSKALNIWMARNK